MSRTIALMLALGVVAAGVLAAGSSGARQTQRTIGLVLPDPNGGAPLSRMVEPGGKSAAAALGDQLVVIPADGPEAMRSAVRSLIAQHAAAIVVNYLVVWAADSLAGGHTFAPGSYQVGGPVGTVSYHAAKQELRLGQPLTITKANLDQYTGK